MKARWFAFVIWAAVAASAAFWALRLFVPSLPVPAHATTVSMAASVRNDLTALLGAEARAAAVSSEPEPVADSRFHLVGVVSPRGATTGSDALALIAVDGKPARAYRVGAAVDGDTVLQSVTSRGAALGPKGGVASVALDIPALAPAATGTMPAANIGATIGTAVPTLPRSAAPSMPRPATMAPPPPTSAVPPLPDVDAQGRATQ
jgi:general secretion pathway protein C